ncbi:MAG: hypothetical protein QXO93_01520 [Acidilobaceae archaeon]
MSVVVEEEYFDKFYRVLRIDSGSTRTYSIDVYMRLNNRLDCNSSISLDNVTICYHKLSQCEAVIVETPGRLELVNLRLITTTTSDPAEDSLLRARELCLDEARRILGI